MLRKAIHSGLQNRCRHIPVKLSVKKCGQKKLCVINISLKTVSNLKSKKMIVICAQETKNFKNSFKLQSEYFHFPFLIENDSWKFELLDTDWPSHTSFINFMEWKSMLEKYDCNNEISRQSSLSLINGEAEEREWVEFL